MGRISNEKETQGSIRVRDHMYPMMHFYESNVCLVDSDTTKCKASTIKMIIKPGSINQDILSDSNS